MLLILASVNSVALKIFLPTSFQKRNNSLGQIPRSRIAIHAHLKAFDFPHQIAIPEISCQATVLPAEYKSVLSATDGLGLYCDLMIWHSA